MVLAICPDHFQPFLFVNIMTVLNIQIFLDAFYKPTNQHFNYWLIPKYSPNFYGSSENISGPKAWATLPKLVMGQILLIIGLIQFVSRSCPGELRSMLGPGQLCPSLKRFIFLVPVTVLYF